MKGFPRHIATRGDIDNLMGYLDSAYATPEMIAKGLAFLRGLLEHASAYQFDRVLLSTEPPDGPEPGYIVLIEDDGSRRQYRLVQDPHARIHRMGYTIQEVQDMIALLERA